MQHISYYSQSVFLFCLHLTRTACCKNVVIGSLGVQYVYLRHQTFAQRHVDNTLLQQECAACNSNCHAVLLLTFGRCSFAPVYPFKCRSFL